MLGSSSICTKLWNGGWLWINPDYLNFPSRSWWEVVKWSKLLSLLQSLHACNAPSWQYVRNDEVEKLRLAGVPGLTQDNVSCIMWHQTSDIGGVRTQTRHSQHAWVSCVWGLTVCLISEATLIPPLIEPPSEWALSQVSSPRCHWSSSGCWDQSDRREAGSSVQAVITVTWHQVTKITLYFVMATFVYFQSFLHL